MVFNSKRRLRAAMVAVVALSVRAENETEAKAAGLAGFAHKGGPPERLLEVIREVNQAKNHTSNLTSPD